MQAKDSEISSEDEGSPAQEESIEKGEVIDLTALIPPSEGTNSLTHLAHTQKALDQVKKSLSAIVDSMAKDPSMLSRAAKIWGGWSIWEKASVGIVITVPTLTIGLVGHLGALLVLSGTTALVYTTGGYILDDHYQSSSLMVEKLKAGVFGITEILALTIDALDRISVKFQEELKKLTANVSKLGEEVKLLSDLHGNIKETHEENHRQLTEKIATLTKANTSLEVTNEKFRLVASVLQTSVVNLSGTVIEEKDNRQIYQEKLNAFITKGEMFANRISETEAELIIVKGELEFVKGELQRTNERYQALLQIQENQISRLEQLGKPPVTAETPKGVSTNPHGFHYKSEPPNKQPLDNNTPQNTPFSLIS